VTPEDLSALLGGAVSDVERMVGGASRETWSLQLDGRPLVLRRDPPGAPRAGAMRREADLLRAAHAAGVQVPEVVAAGDDFIVMQRLFGETIARRILRDDSYAAARAALTAQCATALARLHRGVDVGAVAGLPGETDGLATLRDVLDGFGEPHPALELGFLRLARNRPAAAHEAAVVHGDFRLGNLMVDTTGLIGVLDWELAHLGDPAEDLGWMCVRSWRFGGPAPVMGVGSRSELLDAYAATGGAPIDEERLRWWEAFGTLRWGVICIQQANAHLSGAVRSVELAAIGRRTCEVELDLLELIAPDETASALAASALAATPAVAGQRHASPHDRPTMRELTESVAEWLATLELTGRDGFLGRVATNALGIVGREAELGPAMRERHADRLAKIGVADDAALGGQIRGGRDDADVVRAVCETVVDKVTVADPRQLRRDA
jgi:aminoglycoside phosphotransferase (APT) family kinase protein